MTASPRGEAFGLVRILKKPGGRRPSRLGVMDSSYIAVTNRAVPNGVRITDQVGAHCQRRLAAYTSR